MVCPKKNSQSKHPGVLFEDACTYIILLSLSGGPNSDFLLTWTSTAQFVDSDMKVPRWCSKFLSRLSVNLISEFLL